MARNYDIETALGLMDRAESARRDVLALYEQQQRGYSEAVGKQVADRHQTIGYAQKMADLHLLVSIARSLEVLSGRVTGVAEKVTL